MFFGTLTLYLCIFCQQILGRGSDQEDVEMAELSEEARAEVRQGYRNLMEDIARNEENLIQRTVSLS